MKNRINSIDISVIIQGSCMPIVTFRSLKSIRKFLPNAEIILSAWENSDVSELEGLYDKLILNKDPGAIIYEDAKNIYNNINRLLVSSQSGVKIATRKYVLKLRSDLVLKNNNILKLVDNFNVRNSKKSLFKNRIFAYELFSIKYNERNKTLQKMLFHISDWCYLGLKEDIQELFEVPLVAEPEFSRYFDTHKKTTNDIFPYRFWKMSPEQYITSENARKIIKDLNFENYLDTSDENTKISEDFIINNFVVFSAKEYGVASLKEQYKDTKMFIQSPFTYYSKLEQWKDYKKYCDNSVKIPQVEFVQNLYRKKYYHSLKKHFLLFVYSRPLRKFVELASIIYYLFKFTKELLCKEK